MEVAGFKRTFSLDQGSILGNDQVFQALYNAPLTGGKRGGICCGHWTASHASHGAFGHNRHFYHFDPNMGKYRVGAGDGEAYLKGWVQAYPDTFLGVRHVCSAGLQRG